MSINPKLKYTSPPNPCSTLALGTMTVEAFSPIKPVVKEQAILALAEQFLGEQAKESEVALRTPSVVRLVAFERGDPESHIDEGLKSKVSKSSVLEEVAPNNVTERVDSLALSNLLLESPLITDNFMDIGINREGCELLSELLKAKKLEDLNIGSQLIQISSNLSMGKGLREVDESDKELPTLDRIEELSRGISDELIDALLSKIRSDRISDDDKLIFFKSAMNLMTLKSKTSGLAPELWKKIEEFALTFQDRENLKKVFDAVSQVGSNPSLYNILANIVVKMDALLEVSEKEELNQYLDIKPKSEVSPSVVTIKTKGLKFLQTEKLPYKSLNDDMVEECLKDIQAGEDGVHYLTVKLPHPLARHQFPVILEKKGGLLKVCILDSLSRAAFALPSLTKMKDVFGAENCFVSILHSKVIAGRQVDGFNCPSASMNDLKLAAKNPNFFTDLEKAHEDTELTTFVELNGGDDSADGAVLKEVKAMGDFASVMQPSFHSCRDIPIRVITTLPLAFQAKAQSLSRQEGYIKSSSAGVDAQKTSYLFGERPEKLKRTWKKHQYYIQTPKGDKLMNFRLQNTGAKNLEKIIGSIL